MYKIIEYENIDNNQINGTYALIDVRSPSEYKSETIPGSINIPLLDDEERIKVGTVYVQESVEKAKKLGVEIVSKKLPELYNKAVSLNKEYDNLIFFCFRGGLRSSAITSLFESLGIEAFKLNGGYKKYRKYIIKALPDIVSKVKFVVIHGNTGTGKTQILKILKQKGMDVLDLESCANHRGSFFGSVGLGKQNSQKMFESLIYESLKKRKSNVIFVEGESKRIGKNIIPECVFQKMIEGIHIRVEADLEVRVNNIIRDYVNANNDELIEALSCLKSTLGNRNIERYTDMIRKCEYKDVVRELMIKYYDPLYKREGIGFSYTFNSNDLEKAANEIIKWSKNNLKGWQ